MESFAAWYRIHLAHVGRMRYAWLEWQLHGGDGEHLDDEGDRLDAHDSLIHVEHCSIFDAAFSVHPTERSKHKEDALLGVSAAGEVHWMSETSAPRYMGRHGRLGVKIVGRTLLLLDSFTTRRYALHVPTNTPPQKLYIAIADATLVVTV